jgi:hypothetical protein
VGSAAPTSSEQGAAPLEHQPDGALHEAAPVGLPDLTQGRDRFGRRFGDDQDDAGGLADDPSVRPAPLAPAGEDCQSVGEAGGDPLGQEPVEGRSRDAAAVRPRQAEQQLRAERRAGTVAERVRAGGAGRPDTEQPGQQDLTDQRRASCLSADGPA